MMDPGRMAGGVVEEKDNQGHEVIAACDSSGTASMPGSGSDTRIDAPGRKEKRKALKKMKRKQYRQQIAEFEKLEKEADPAEQEELETQAMELERKEHEEQMRLWLEREQQAKEEAARRQEEEQLKEKEAKEKKEEESDSEYVEDGPAEIIWEGNEITVKKRKVKVDKLEAKTTEVTDRPTSNPPPPQITANYRSLYEGLDQNRNFGTEQDKTHCPFHIKTGACRFGARCSRVHVYPEKSCTLLIKNMYTGPGLAWEHDEGLELVIRLAWDSISKVVEVNTSYTDEEVAEQYEEFYEDVHSEFLKFGELVNFKVCRNGSPHLRGNVYVHYRFEDCAMAAYNALIGRFYASKQVIPECVGVTRWKVAICGEYMRAHHATCSRGTACNFLHCFRNPGGEYDWADWDAPPPRAWQRKMASLFGYQDIHHDSEHSRETERDGRDHRKRERDKHHPQKERQVRSKHEHRNNSEDNRRHARNSRQHSDSDGEYERPRDGYRSHSDDSGGENNRRRGRSEKERERWTSSKKARAVSERRRHRSSWDKVQGSDRWQGSSLL